MYILYYQLNTIKDILWHRPKIKTNTKILNPQIIAFWTWITANEIVLPEFNH